MKLSEGMVAAPCESCFLLFWHFIYQNKTGKHQDGVILFTSAHLGYSPASH
ncbi:hypothetical protein [uncultured Aquitalea sp.]|uniref:hypothetical protein n=1 Tax=uncultured Aquitalea sp. TaxID=540272 RepID=UPI0025F7E333|nr:hypothetical protein [uncultured Aquitalea sp.]